MMNIGSVVRHAGRSLLDLALPAHCPACDTIVAADGELCGDCFREASFLVDPSCLLCASPFASLSHAGPSRCCAACVERPPAWDAARAAFIYDAFSRRLILPLKYADRTENAIVLGRQMARAGAELLESSDLVVPVPLHRTRLRTRRYNQAVLLAREAIRGSTRRPKLMVDGLVRQRATLPLAVRSAVERRRELDGAIVVRRSSCEQIAGARVLLVDDVLTTGSTATACAIALKNAGAVTVSLLVAARTAAPRFEQEVLSCAAAGRSLPIVAVEGN